MLINILDIYIKTLYYNRSRQEVQTKRTENFLKEIKKSVDKTKET